MKCGNGNGKQHRQTALAPRRGDRNPSRVDSGRCHCVGIAVRRPERGLATHSVIAATTRAGGMHTWPVERPVGELRPGDHDWLPAVTLQPPAVVANVQATSPPYDRGAWRQETSSPYGWTAWRREGELTCTGRATWRQESELTVRPGPPGDRLRFPMNRPNAARLRRVRPLRRRWCGVRRRGGRRAQGMAPGAGREGCAAVPGVRRGPAVRALRAAPPPRERQAPW